MSDTGARIASLDITRGVAVMGILSVNIIAMAMIKMAYFYPPADGWETIGDKLLWLGNFLFVDGKLRALFSMMFGASLLLVIDRAIATARSPARTHFARMVVLLVIGWLHWALLWWGDILTHYAAVGMAAYLFHKLRPKWLFGIAAALLLINAVPSAVFTVFGIQQYEQVQAGTADKKATEQAAKMKSRFFPDATVLAEDRAAHADPVTHARTMLADEGPLAPVEIGPLWFETLGLMLLGMALYRNGFLTGSLAPTTYRRVAFWALGTGLAGYAAAAFYAIAHEHQPPYQMAAYGGFTPILRPWMATGYAALVILLCRQGRADGWWARRFAAVGRCAFSNYIGSTLVGTLLFFGFAGGLYDRLSRFEAWLFVPFIWLGMLLWSKWWLDRYHYGPLEWVWRSLARWQRQPMRKLAATGE